MNKLLQELKEARDYCQEQNGLPCCKNCGLEHQKFVDVLKAYEEFVEGIKRMEERDKDPDDYSWKEIRNDLLKSLEERL